jgi:hypothetical protein
MVWHCRLRKGDCIFSLAGVVGEASIPQKGFNKMVDGQFSLLVGQDIEHQEDC